MHLQLLRFIHCRHLEESEILTAPLEGRGRPGNTSSDRTACFQQEQYSFFFSKEAHEIHVLAYVQCRKEIADFAASTTSTNVL